MLLGRRRGGCHPRGSGGVGPVRLEAEACCHPPCLGRSRERGTRCRLPSTGGAIAVRQEAEEHRVVHQRCPVPSHGTASKPLSWLRTKQQCVREPDQIIIIFFPLSPLSSLSLLILPFVYFIIKVFKCSPVPASFPIYELCYRMYLLNLCKQYTSKQSHSGMYND